MTSERRLHPFTLIFGFVSIVREHLFPLAAATLGGLSAEGMSGGVFGLSAVFGLLAVVTVARYVRFTYRYDADEIVIHSGVLFRKERHIPYARIQNIDAVQNVFQRALRVVVVHVQTASGAEPEASLRVLPVADLEEMRQRVGRSGGRVEGTDTASALRTSPANGTSVAEVEPAAVGSGSIRPGSRASERSVPGAGSGAYAGSGDETASGSPPRRILLQLGTRELLLAGFIENRGLVVVLGALAVVERLDLADRLAARFNLPSEAAIEAMIGRWIATGLQSLVLILIGILALLLVIRLLSMVWTTVRLYGYQLTRTGDDLRVEYGMFTRVTATIPLRRVQVIAVQERLLHRLLRRVQVNVVTAGGVGGQAGTPKREQVAPILARERLTDLLTVLQPGLDVGSPAWQRIHPRAFGRMVRGSLLGPVVLSAIAALIVGWWALALLGALLARLIVDRTLRARYLAWATTPDSLIMRGGGLRRVLRVARFSRIQTVALKHGPFDRRAGMANLSVATAGTGGGVSVPYLARDVADALHARLAATVAASEFTW